MEVYMLSVEKVALKMYIYVIHPGHLKPGGYQKLDEIVNEEGLKIFYFFTLFLRR